MNGMGAQQLTFPRESVASLHLDLMYNPAGPEIREDVTLRRLAEGSGFLYRIDGHDHLVTARHNVTGRHWQTNACLGDMPVEPTHLRVAFLPAMPAAGWPLAVDAEGGTASMQLFMRLYLLPLVGDDWQPLWKQHPDWGSRMDVAVLPLPKPPGDVLLAPWETTTIDPAGSPWQELSTGDDLFIIGYPYGLSSGPVFPLWMRGTVASLPTMGYRVGEDDLPLMLVDARTRTGQSGSVAARRKPPGSPMFNGRTITGFTYGNHSQIVGVYSGRTSDESDLGYVWRIDAVDRICREGVPGTIWA